MIKIVLNIAEFIGYCLGKTLRAILPKRWSVRLRRKLDLIYGKIVAMKMLDIMASREEERARNMGLKISDFEKRVKEGTWQYREWELGELLMEAGYGETGEKRKAC